MPVRTRKKSPARSFLRLFSPTPAWPTQSAIFRDHIWTCSIFCSSQRDAAAHAKCHVDTGRAQNVANGSLCRDSQVAVTKLQGPRKAKIETELVKDEKLFFCLVRLSQLIDVGYR